MEVDLTPELERKLADLVALSGRAPVDLLEDALAGYSLELAETRETLDSRYDDIKSGRVKLIPGEEAKAYFREKSTAARRKR